jgi:hypothetical protein
MKRSGVAKNAKLVCGRALEIGSEIEVRRVDGTWYSAKVYALHPRSPGGGFNHFSVEGMLGTLPIGLFRGTVWWRWPATEPARRPPPKAANPEPTITLKDHHARLFAIRIDDALNAIASLDHLHASHLFINRTVLRLTAQAIDAAETPRPLRNGELAYAHNVFLDASEATKRLRQENTAVRRSVQRLNDCYESMSKELTPLFAVNNLRDLIKHDVIGVPPERLKFWERLWLEWEIINSEAAKLAQRLTKNPDSDATP